MRGRYVINRSNRTSLSRSKYIIVACCAAIAMILGAMSVGATRVIGNPSDGSDKPILLNEDTSYTGDSASKVSTNPLGHQSDELGSLHRLSANVSRPYTEPSKNKQTTLNVLLGANPIRLNAAADNKGLQIKLEASSATPVPSIPSVLDTVPTDTTPAQDNTPTDTTVDPATTNTGDSSNPSPAPSDAPATNPTL